VQYFGEAYDRDDCGACDVCLGELEIVDEAVTVARKVLSCVARVEQRFGAAHVTNVLIGKDSEAVTARGHAQLSTFGLFSSVPATEVRGYIEQLTALGFLKQTTGDYPVLVLTPEGRLLMRDGTSDGPVALFRQKRRAKDSGPRRSRVETESWEGVDRDLFERLREVRLTLARGRGVPPYVIFHDTTLREMARLKPASSAALRDIYGVGQRKAEDVGPAFLDVINRANPL
jgi:ATP-dependent DNA helicase RecQ